MKGHIGIALLKLNIWEFLSYAYWSVFIIISLQIKKTLLTGTVPVNDFLLRGSVHNFYLTKINDSFIDSFKT